MADHPSAKKRHRQSLKRRARNKHTKSTVRGAIRSVRSTVAAGGDATDGLTEAERLLRRAGSKGVFHKKTVSRTVSRLTRLVQRSV
jgi:small subunit ribosomal protein S20